MGARLNFIISNSEQRIALELLSQYTTSKPLENMFKIMGSYLLQSWMTWHEMI
jgi:hypothetical protein